MKFEDYYIPINNESFEVGKEGCSNCKYADPSGWCNRPDNAICVSIQDKQGN